MTELFVVLVAVALLRDRVGAADPETVAVIALAAWVPTYLISCVWWPYRTCPWPWCTKRRPTAGDKRGNYRRRRRCRVCAGGDYRRLGARIIGSG